MALLLQRHAERVAPQIHQVVEPVGHAAAERAVRGTAVGRRNWTFCGSDAGGERAAVIVTLIETAKLCDIDPKAWLADVLARIGDHRGAAATK